FKMTSNITGIRTNRNGGEAISFYPNPFTDLVNLDLTLESGYTGMVSIQVYNMAGMVVTSHTADRITGGQGTVTLDLAGEPRGYYILKVNAGGEVHSVVLNKQ
ncbi:MAG: T9SS type A sorting domain-containing protein, partial [Bacteroidales bacterium]|nr:T9SS type A sorting domain-containing protein [Bacteroidales bacterium]